MSKQKILTASVIAILFLVGIVVIVDEFVTDKTISKEIEKEIAIEKAELINNTAETENITGTSTKTNLQTPDDSIEQKNYKFDYVLLLSSAEKKQFLKELFDALKAYDKNGVISDEYLNDAEALAVILAQLALDDSKSVSAQALLLINLLAFVPGSNSILPNFTQSVEIKAALEQLIMIDETDDDLKGRAIDAYSLIYPPEDAMISKFEQIIAKGGFDEGDTLTAIFSAFSNYKKLHNYDMPASILEQTKKLIEHPSDSVKSDAMYNLSKSLGKPFLPVLFHELRNRHGLSVKNTIVVSILLLDQSDETIQQLKEFAAELPEGSYIAGIIYNNTLPKSIEHYKKMSKQREADL